MAINKSEKIFSRRLAFGFLIFAAVVAFVVPEPAAAQTLEDWEVQHTCSDDFTVTDEGDYIFIEIASGACSAGENIQLVMEEWQFANQSDVDWYIDWAGGPGGHHARFEWLREGKSTLSTAGNVSLPFDRIVQEGTNSGVNEDNIKPIITIHGADPEWLRIYEVRHDGEVVLAPSEANGNGNGDPEPPTDPDPVPFDPTALSWECESTDLSGTSTTFCTKWVGSGGVTADHFAFAAAFFLFLFTIYGTVMIFRS